MSPRNKPIQQNRRPSTGASGRIYSRENVNRYSERARQRRRSRAIKRGVLTGVLAVLLVAVGAAGLWFSRVVNNLGGNGYIQSSGILDILQDSQVTKEPFYVLLLGTDGRPGETNYRSDSIILARVDPTEKQATLISIPRDTKVTFKGSTMKINAIHSYDESDGGGPKGMVEAVNKLCGVEISHYAEVSFDGMQQLIDAIGGIDINATDGVDDPEHLDITIQPGQQHMDGATALTYARARYQYADGDYTRMRHQRQVLGAMANKVLNDLDATKLPALVESVSQMVMTDMSVQDILAVINAMRGMDVDGIYSANLPSYADYDTDGVSYVFVDEDALATMMERVNAGEDPQGPQTMGDGSGNSSTLGDINANTSEDYSNGTDQSVSSSSSSSEGDGASDAGDGGEAAQ